jgi:hypothetical protein
VTSDAIGNRLLETRKSWRDRYDPPPLPVTVIGGFERRYANAFSRKTRVIRNSIV